MCNEYRYEEPCKSLVTFYNKVWYGVNKVAPELIKSRYFSGKEEGQTRSFWQRVATGSLVHTVGNLHIESDIHSGIRVFRLQVGEKTNIPKMVSTGEGFDGSAYIFRGKKQVGYISITKLQDGSDKFAADIAKEGKFDKSELTVRKTWDSINV